MPCRGLSRACVCGLGLMVENLGWRAQGLVCRLYALCATATCLRVPVSVGVEDLGLRVRVQGVGF